MGRVFYESLTFRLSPLWSPRPPWHRPECPEKEKNWKQENEPKQIDKFLLKTIPKSILLQIKHWSHIWSWQPAMQVQLKQTGIF